MALNTIYNAIDSKVFEQIKDCERANEVWRRLEETYEGTPVVKSAKLYILKDKLTSFKMKEDESIPEMFHRLQVIVNDLKSLGEKIKDDDVSHRFLMCLPPRFEMLRLLIIRGGLKDITPNQVLGDVMTHETYRVEREGMTRMTRRKKKTRRRRVYHSRLAHHHPRTRASPRKNQVMMMILMILMMKLWPSLSAR